MDVVTLSRLQFGLTAMYHFLFVPLTLGLSVLLAIMESIYVTTGRTIWRDMVKFWGTLFGINFAMGVATGMTLEFQFGTNWAYYSHYVGDIFGAPLAIEGLMAFFLEATFVGLFFFGWERLSRVQHLTVTCLLALGTNLSALWILIANGWMQNPVGARFNPATMRMEVTDFTAVLFNPVAQAKFVHTVSAGYVTGAMFVLSISAFYLLRGRNRGLAIRSITVAASFGLASALSVVVLGDESGYTAGQNQKMKIAAIESMWHTEAAPASFTIVGLPDMATRSTSYAVRIPWVLGMIATRSLDGKVAGIDELVAALGAADPERHGCLQGDGGASRESRRPDAPGSVQRACGRSRLRLAAQALCAQRHRRNAGANRGGRLVHRARCAAAVLDLPRHGRYWASISSYCSQRCSGRLPRGRSSVGPGCCVSACGHCRCPGSPPSSAGTWRRAGGSPGRSTACCRPSSRSPACRRAAWSSRSPAS